MTETERRRVSLVKMLNHLECRLREPASDGYTRRVLSIETINECDSGAVPVASYELDLEDIAVLRSGLATDRELRDQLLNAQGRIRGMAEALLYVEADPKAISALVDEAKR